MHTKLTLRLDEQLIQFAKDHAARVGKSLSQLVADYFQIIQKPIGNTPALPPMTAALKGILKTRSKTAQTAIDKKTYQRYLAEKYR